MGNVGSVAGLLAVLVGGIGAKPCRDYHAEGTVDAHA